MVRFNKKYYLNSEWIQQVKKFVTNFEEKYKTEQTTDLSQEEKIIQTFDKEEILKTTK